MPTGFIIDESSHLKNKEKDRYVFDRVFNDNLYQFGSETEILTQLENELKCPMIIIPEYPNDLTGHAY